MNALRPYAKAIVAIAILGVAAIGSAFGMELPYQNWLEAVLVGGAVYQVSNG